MPDDHAIGNPTPLPQTQLRLVKHYPSGSVIEVRTITRPVAGTEKVYLDGVGHAVTG